MKIGVYVGSFNPPHKGHMHVAKFLIHNHYVDKILLLPTPSYWDKQNLASMQDRINMLNFLANRQIVVDKIHNMFPYTYQVLESIKKDYPNDELYLILGSDNLKKLHLWKNIDEILKYKILILQRGTKDIQKYLNKFNTNNFIIVNNFKFINISSTEIRKSITKDYLDINIYNYIKENKLYESE